MGPVPLLKEIEAPFSVNRMDEDQSARDLNTLGSSSTDELFLFAWNKVKPPYFCKVKILLLDNYDSFTFNLYHYLESTGNHQIDVFRNDEIKLDEIKNYDKIVLSPGPGLPSEAGILMKLIKEYYSSKSILGVCLGHQAIAECFGAKLKNLNLVVHGQSKPIYKTDNSDYIFNGLPSQFNVGRYHSWVIDKKGLPKELKISSEDEQGEIMSFYHSNYNIRGIQFHPESILTEFGKEMIDNWVKS